MEERIQTRWNSLRLWEKLDRFMMTELTQLRIRDPIPSKALLTERQLPSVFLFGIARVGENARELISRR